MAYRSRRSAPLGYEVIYRPWVTNRRTGRRIYPKRARVFSLLVRVR
jgi:hypothetical protein